MVIASSQSILSYFPSRGSANIPALGWKKEKEKEKEKNKGDTRIFCDRRNVTWNYNVLDCRVRYCEND